LLKFSLEGVASMDTMSSNTSMVFTSELWLVTSWDKVVAPASEVREQLARCLITSGTFHSGAAVMEVVVLGPFGNFQFGF
jgi:hypothetical protein